MYIIYIPSKNSEVGRHQIYEKISLDMGDKHRLFAKNYQNKDIGMTVSLMNRMDERQC